MASDGNLSVLLSKLLFQYTCDWEAAATEPLSLLFWSNFLRPVGGGTVGLAEIHRVARLSRRAIRPALKDRRWFVVAEVGAGRGRHEVRLTEAGLTAFHDGANRFEVVDATWRARFGADASDALRRAVDEFVGVLPLELAHYPMPYGPADERITGGNAVAAHDGAVPVPAHGRDWPVVPRETTDIEPGIRLPALVSQALIAFAIDFEIRAEAWRTGNSMSVTALLSLLSRDGVAADLVPTTRAVRSLEQDGLLSVELDSTAPRKKRLRLTEDGVRFQASNLARLDDVEREWRTRYGTRLIDTLRRSATTILDVLDPGPPDQVLIVFIPGSGFVDVTRSLAPARQRRDPPI